MKDGDDDDDDSSSMASQLSRALGTVYQGSSMKARPHADRAKKLQTLAPLGDLRSDDDSAMKDGDNDDDDGGSSMASQLSRAVGTMYQGSSKKARPHADRAKKLKTLAPLRDLRSDDESAMKCDYGLYQYPSRHSVDHISDALQSSSLVDEPTMQRTDILGILSSSYVGMQQDMDDGGETAVDDDLNGMKSVTDF
jgi:hypothetical protein